MRRWRRRGDGWKACCASPKHREHPGHFPNRSNLVSDDLFSLCDRAGVSVMGGGGGGGFDSEVF